MANTTGKKFGGREKGVSNKDTVSIRDAFKLLIENNLETLQSDLKALKPNERIKAIIELSKFCVPTLKAVDFTDNTPVQKEPVKILFIKK